VVHVLEVKRKASAVMSLRSAAEAMNTGLVLTLSLFDFS
jgi:hypothetical protein